MLTSKQEQFCQEYIKDNNAAAAAIRAGYSDRSAREIGYENLTKPHIVDRIAELRKEIADRNNITIDDIIQENKRIAFSKISNIIEYDSDGLTIKTFDQLSDDVIATISGIKITKEGIEVKFWDKQKSLDMLSKHLGFYEKDSRKQKKKKKPVNIIFSKANNE